MKGIKRFYALFFSIIWFLSGPIWANEVPKIFVQSYANHIVAGGHHSIAIDENGQLWAWGSNGSGRLGNATAGTKASVPVPVNTVSGDGQLSNIISVAAGFSHSIALLDNGRVVAWGSNNSRQLGNVSINQSSYLPVYVNGPAQEMFLSDIIAVAAGQQHSVALCSDGTVWTWGDNTKGQLGNNSLFTQERPIQVTDSQGTGFLSQIIAIAAGAYHTLALDDNGYIWAWGNNADGQLGFGSDVSVHQSPFPINDLSNITHICAGESHSLARKSNGTVWAWGNNADGQLGYETGKTFSNIPHQVMAPDGLTNLLNVINIAAGSDHSLALKNDTTLMAWGKNDNGQLGDGTQGSVTFPVWVKDTNGIDPVKNIIEISAGDGHSLALRKDGQVLAWGNNNDGQLGNMSATQRLLPIYVRDESAEKTLQLGIQQILVHVSEDQSADAIPLILRDTDGQNLKLSALSSNESLIPAQHFEFNYHSQPYTVPVPSEESVSVSFTFKTAENQYGAGNITIVAEDTLGASDTVLLQIIVIPVNDPPLISNIDNIEIDEDTISPIIPFMVQDVDQDDLTVTARSFHTTVIAPSGITLTGDAQNRQIQISPLPDQYGSALISLTVSDPSGLSSEETFYVHVQSVNDIPKMRIWPGIRQVACGYHHNIAIKNDWTVWAWGFNGAGQLGDDTQSPHNLPTQVKGRDGIGWLTDIIAVAGGSQHSVALSGDGHVLAWGGNDYGQLGNGTGASSFVPVYVLNEDNLPFEDVIAIASGTNHVLLVTENNELWAWGNNENGQLANSVALSYNRPIRVAGLPGSHRIVQTAAGYAHSLALLDNGEIWAWGDNTFGQLGIGDSVSAMNPTQVVQEDGNPLTNIVSIAAGAFHSLALSNDGTIWAFGSNQEGQGGNGGLSHISIPAKVQHPENGMPLANIARIAAGTDHSLAIQNNGVVWAWGNNKQGQLGDGTKDNHHLPQIIQGTDLQLDQIISVDAGKHHSVLHAGDIWAWGANYSFQLGTGIAEESLVPTQTLSPDGSEPFVPGLFSLEFYTSDGIPAHPIHVSLYDLETQSTALKFAATSHDPQILPQENIVLKGSGVNRQIILTPLVDRTGKVSVELMVSDNTDSFTQQLTLGVNKFSLAPTVSDIADQMANEDQAVTNLSFTIDDPDTPIDQLSVQVTSSNISLVPNHPDMLNWSDEGEHRTLSITPIENQFGKTIITLRVTDGINIARSTFTLTFQPVNDPPKLSRIDDQEISSNEFSKSVGFSITDIETEPKNLSTWVISSNPAIVPNDEHHLIISGTENHRTLGITPSREEAGELTITIYASDGIETCATSFHLMVQNYKKSPQLSDIENQIIQEDTSLTIEFTVTDGDSDVNELAFSLSSSNKQVIPNDTANLVLSGSGENRSLLIVPEPDQVGSVSITIEVKDSDKLYDQESFMVTVENVNDTPTISGIIDQAIKENTSTPELEFTIHDIETSAEALLLTVNSANPNLVPNDDVHLKLTGESNNRKLVVTPKADTTGDTVIRIQLSDGELAVWESFVLTVEPENFPPEISTITDQFTEVNTAIEIDFTISDPESPSGSLIVTALSSDPELVPNDTNHLKLSRGTGSDDRCLTITPLADVCGSLTITLMVKDDLSTTEQAFSLTINYPPTISSISNRRTNEDTQTPPIPFVVNDQDTNIHLLETTAHSDNTALIPNDIEHIIFNGDGQNRTLRLLPESNQFGSATIEIQVSDGYSQAKTSFLLTVDPVNDPPTMSIIGQVVTDEDAPKLNIPVTISDLETSSDLLTISVISENPTLVPLQNIAITEKLATRYLSITPAADQNGDTQIQIEVSDPEGLTALQTFLFQVNSVNDRPTAVGQTHHIRINVPLNDQLEAYDIDGDNLIYDISAHPEIGTITLVNTSTGEFIYHPFIEKYGQDAFQFVVSDGEKTSLDATVEIIIQDNIPPEITLKGLNPDYILQGDLFYDFGYTAFDNADGNLNDRVETIGSVNTDIVGTYHITYRVKDFSGNVAQKIREVSVLHSYGQLQGIVENIPTIADPVKDIAVQLLDPVSEHLLRETSLDKTGRFSFVYLPYQTYILHLDISDHNNVPPVYLPKTVDQLFLFQSNNQEIHVSIPELTEMKESYKLTVSLDGDYKDYDNYEYRIIDYRSGQTVLKGSGNSTQFTEQLEADMSYRLLILADCYSPFEYENDHGDPYIEIKQDKEVKARLTDDTGFHLDDVQVDVSHTLFDTDNHKGFHLWFVRKNYNTVDKFQVTIQSQANAITVNDWDSFSMVDGHPYDYTWTVSTANQQHLYVKKEPLGSDTHYTVIFHFLRGSSLIQDYTVVYIDQSQDSTNIPPEKSIVQNFMNNSVTYETQSESRFYPLAGVDLNISFRNSVGDIKHKGVSIPAIPLDYLKVADQQKPLESSDQLVARVKYYTFGGNSVSDAISVDFRTLDNQAVVYNPKYDRKTTAPTITVPLHLNRHATYFEDLMQNQLSQAANMLHVVVHDNTDPTSGFQQENIPFVIQDDGLVLVKIRHLSTIALEINDNWNAFKEKGINDGRCFIHSLCMISRFGQAWIFLPLLLIFAVVREIKRRRS